MSDAEIAIERRTPVAILSISAHPEPYFWQATYRLPGSPAPSYSGGFATDVWDGIDSAARLILGRQRTSAPSAERVELTTQQHTEETDMATDTKAKDATKVTISDGNGHNVETTLDELAKVAGGPPSEEIDIDKTEQAEPDPDGRSFEGPEGGTEVTRQRYAIVNFGDSSTPRSAALSAMNELQKAVEIPSDSGGFDSYERLDLAYAHVLRAADDVAACKAALKKQRDGFVGRNEFRQIELSLAPTPPA